LALCDNDDVAMVGGVEGESEASYAATDDQEVAVCGHLPEASKPGMAIKVALAEWDMEASGVEVQRT